MRTAPPRLAAVPLVAFCMVAALAACGRSKVKPPPLVAQVSGTMEVDGLTAPVRIIRDRSGVPHIFAGNQDDLFFAQGFVQAQDRLFQMDLWRRAAQGRLAEVLGPNFVERDAMTRRVQYRGDLETEWASYGPDTKQIASAFVRGVNAWVALARERPPEEFVLAGWKPELWAPEDLLNRTDAFAGGGDAVDEIFRARLVTAIGARRVDALFARDGATRIPPGLDPSIVSSVVGDAIRRVGTPPFFVGLAAAVPAGDSQPEPGVEHVLPNPDTTILDHPSRRYLVHLNAPGWNVVGATSPWLPGVALGHNDQLAWDATPYAADTQDVFIERVNPSNPHQVEDHGGWVDTEIVKQPIGILRNPKPFVFETEFTRHGVIVALDRTRSLAFAVRWSGSEPGTAGELAALAIDRARSAAEFVVAVARWRMPARRFTYAAVDGATGTHIAALIPDRRGWTGALPAPAWSGTNEWAGWQTPSAGAATATSDAAALARWARAHPDRADTLLARLAAEASASDGARLQRTSVAEALADAARAETAGVAPVVFAHPLGITEAARRRFNVGPLRLMRGDVRPVAVTSERADWDRSTAMNAPGQSGSPANPHFGDLATVWAAGGSIPLPFTDAAVKAAAESTLTLTNRPGSR